MPSCKAQAPASTSKNFQELLGLPFPASQELSEVPEALKDTRVVTKLESSLELAQQRLISLDLNHSEVPNEAKGAGNPHPRDPTSPGNRNPAPPVMVTGGNGCPGALQLPEGTKRISQGLE